VHNVVAEFLVYFWRILCSW